MCWKYEPLWRLFLSPLVFPLTFKLNPDQTDLQIDESFRLAFNLRFVWPPTCVHFARAQIRTQVDTSFSPLATQHTPTQVDRKSPVYRKNPAYKTTWINPNLRVHLDRALGFVLCVLECWKRRNEGKVHKWTCYMWSDRAN